MSKIIPMLVVLPLKIFAQDCQYHVGSPSLIESKVCRTDGIKLCTGEVQCGAKKIIVVCPAESLTSCPPANNCVANNKSRPLIEKKAETDLSLEQLTDVDGAWMKLDCKSQVTDKAKGLLFDYAINQIKGTNK